MVLIGESKEVMRLFGFFLRGKVVFSGFDDLFG